MSIRAAVVGVGRMVDIVEHKKKGYLHQPFDIARIVYALSTLLCDTELPRNARRASRSIDHRFDLSVIADGCDKIFQEVLALQE